MAHQQLWYDNTERELGEGYPWFVERAERFIAKCDFCKGTGTIPREPKKTDLTTPYPQTTQACISCSVYVHRLKDFTLTYFHRMPPAYRQHTLGNLQPYEGTASV